MPPPKKKGGLNPQPPSPRFRRPLSHNWFYISYFIQEKDLELWKKVTTDSHHLNDLLPMKRMWKLRDRSHHDYILPLARTERFKRCFAIHVFLILSRFSIYILYFGIYYYAIVVHSPVSLSVVSLAAVFSIVTQRSCCVTILKTAARETTILVTNLETLVWFSPSPMLIWVLQSSHCFKIRLAQHCGRRGANVSENEGVRSETNGSCFNDLWRVL